ncbi:MAG: VWA domain-containing protein, partial [Candidatus Liptonbacteria bacterium]|nr:VWA domain-containing protein [Candidatus Liptonbacteria bacterium]
MRELYDAWQKLSFIEPGYLIISWIIACLAILFAVALVIRWIRVPPKTRGSRYPLIHGSWFWAMIMGVVSLMTFAAARPYLKDKSGILETGNVRVIVIVDHSISMRAKDLGKERLEVAKDEISKLPDILKTGDQVALFVFAKSSRCKMPLSSDFDRFVNEVQDIGFPGHLYGDEFVWDTDYPLALGHVVEILDAQAAFRKEIGIKFSSRPSTGPIILFLLSDGDDQVQ